MALTGKITLESGIELKKAVIVVTGVSDNNGSNFSFSQHQVPNAKGQFNEHIDDKPQRSTGFEAKVYFDEKSLREGKPAIGPLTIRGQSYIELQPDEDTNKMELVTFAYAHLKEAFDKLNDLDLSDLKAI